MSGTQALDHPLPVNVEVPPKPAIMPTIRRSRLKRRCWCCAKPTPPYNQPFSHGLPARCRRRLINRSDPVLNGLGNALRPVVRGDMTGQPRGG